MKKETYSKTKYIIMDFFQNLMNKATKWAIKESPKDSSVAHARKLSIRALNLEEQIRVGRPYMEFGECLVSLMACAGKWGMSSDELLDAAYAYLQHKVAGTLSTGDSAATSSPVLPAAGTNTPTAVPLPANGLKTVNMSHTLKYKEFDQVWEVIRFSQENKTVAVVSVLQSIDNLKYVVFYKQKNDNNETNS